MLHSWVGGRKGEYLVKNSVFSENFAKLFPVVGLGNPQAKNIEEIGVYSNKGEQPPPHWPSRSVKSAPESKILKNTILGCPFEAGLQGEWAMCMWRCASQFILEPVTYPMPHKIHPK